MSHPSGGGDAGGEEVDDGGLRRISSSRGDCSSGTLVGGGEVGRLRVLGPSTKEIPTADTRTKTTTNTINISDIGSFFLLPFEKK